eukprot:INCI13533.1.p1 GENE.INCI13533.1~~INCI13533.1.p1  ORF type:complete len:166 (+),score=35.01 INCI13533.1:118-615(+)
MNATSYNTGAEIDEVFDHFDTGDNGMLVDRESITQAIYSTGCAPTLDAIDAAVAEILSKTGEEGLSKKDFKLLMLNLQRNIPREQSVLDDLKMLRGSISPETFTAAAFENIVRNVGDKLTDVEASNFASLVHAHLDASGVIDQYSLSHTMLHFQDTALEAEAFLP